MLEKIKANWLRLTVVGFALFFLSFFIYLRYRDATFGIKASSASNWSDKYAENVAAFCTFSNSLPNADGEISEYILGDYSTNGWYYKTVNASTKQFLLGQNIDSSHVFEATYQISETGLIRQSSQVIEKSTHARK